MNPEIVDYSQWPWLHRADGSMDYMPAGCSDADGLVYRARQYRQYVAWAHHRQHGILMQVGGSRVGLLDQSWLPGDRPRHSEPLTFLEWLGDRDSNAESALYGKTPHDETSSEGSRHLGSVCSQETIGARAAVIE